MVTSLAKMTATGSLLSCPSVSLDHLLRKSSMRHCSSRTLSQSRLAKLALSVMNSPNLLQAAYMNASLQWYLCIAEEMRQLPTGKLMKQQRQECTYRAYSGWKLATDKLGSWSMSTYTTTCPHYRHLHLTFMSISMSKRQYCLYVKHVKDLQA